jgi:hypothetical protein
MEAIKIAGRLEGTNCHGRYWSVAVGIFAEANNRTYFKTVGVATVRPKPLAAKCVADPIQGFRTADCSNRMLVSEYEILL